MSSTPSSILDLVGPVLPQALRLARYQASPTLPQKVDELTNENDTINQTPSHEEERLLASNAAVVAELEDLFSWREKDRTSRTSKLSRIESARFQRAIYRIWLMSELFGTRRFTLRKRNLTTEKSRRLAAANLGKSWKDQKAFLQVYSLQELLQIHRLARFLILTASWACTAEECKLLVEDRHASALFGSPRVILRCHEDCTTTHLGLAREHLGTYGPHTQFLSKALHEVIFERCPITEPLGHGYVGIILDDLTGGRDRCHQCGHEGVRTYCNSVEKAGLLPGLYNETNWTELKGLLGHRTIIPTNLSHNLVEEPLKQALRGDWSKLLPEVFACKDKWPQRSKEHWVCLYCWDFLLWKALRKWQLAEKNKAGVCIEKDRKYGCACEKQCGTEGLDHAETFNHLCDQESIAIPGDLPFRYYTMFGIPAVHVFTGLFGLLCLGFLMRDRARTR